jgi:hypothetical protein
MVGLQDTGCVNYCGIVGPGHIRRSPLSQRQARRSIPQAHM